MQRQIEQVQDSLVHFENYLFAEVRYHYADTGRIATRMVPIAFGIGW